MSDDGRPAEIWRQGSRSLLFQIVQGSTIPTFVINRDHRVAYWNRALENISGIPATAVVGTNRHWQAFYGSERPCMADLLLDCALTEHYDEFYPSSWRPSSMVEHAYEAEGFFPRLGENGLWLFFTAAPLLDARGQPIGAIETLQDISARKQAEARIAENERRLASLIESAMDAIITIDAEQRIVLFNSAAEHLFGYPRGDLLGQPLELLLPETSRDAHRAHVVGFGASGVVSRAMFRLGNPHGRRADGSEFPVEATISHTMVATGTQYTVILRDLSERRQAEAELDRYRHYLEDRVTERTRELTEANQELREVNRRLEEAHHQLLQSEKMASIGQLAAGVAHEINNPIGFVSSNLNSLESYFNQLMALIELYEHHEDSMETRLMQVLDAKKKMDFEFLRADLVELLAESKDGLSRVKKIVQDLRDFSHVGAADWTWVDLHAGLDSTLNIVNSEIKYRAEVVREYGDLPQVECLPLELNQVFMNLLIKI